MNTAGILKIQNQLNSLICFLLRSALISGEMCKSFQTNKQKITECQTNRLPSKCKMFLYSQETVYDSFLQLEVQVLGAKMHQMNERSVKHICFERSIHVSPHLRQMDQHRLLK